MAVIFTDDVSELDDGTTPMRGWLSAAVCWTRWTHLEHPTLAWWHRRVLGGPVGGYAGVQVFLVCLVYLLTECVDAVGAQSLLSKKTMA